MGSWVTQRRTGIEIRIFIPLGFVAQKRLVPASTYVVRMGSFHAQLLRKLPRI